jgi:hypothetical protein
MLEFLKGKNINIAVFEGILKEEIKIAIEEYEKAKVVATPKKTEKKETESIADAMKN